MKKGEFAIEAVILPSAENEPIAVEAMTLEQAREAIQVLGESLVEAYASRGAVYGKVS
jgi:hypothetical protein